MRDPAAAYRCAAVKCRMAVFTLETDNREQLATLLEDDVWVVACLCAAWCDVCRQYQPGFEALASEHPDKRFVWIDIEDQADVVGDLDVDNFPTILIQRGDTVAFYGTMLPEPRQVHRLMQSLSGKTSDELAAEARSNAQRTRWQDECNLRARLDEALNG